MYLQLGVVVAKDTSWTDDNKIVVPVPASVEEFDSLMAQLGDLHRNIELLKTKRDDAVAKIDKSYNAKRKPLVALYNALIDSCTAFVENPDNKGRMTTSKAPQTADLVHGKVKWTEDHSGQIALADDVDETTAINALLRRKGGSQYVITTRKLNWTAIRADSVKLVMMRHFTRRFKPTSVALYVKPASTPKPDGKAAETQVRRLT